ncbi:MAG: bifunctional DNA primase/polymerase [Deltaproteobacteria bacterium]|nr:bifunctional DNA primase/polymerase [Deltaproteobacteria bacterium]
MTEDMDNAEDGVDAGDASDLGADQPDRSDVLQSVCASKSGATTRSAAALTVDEHAKLARHRAALLDHARRYIALRWCVVPLAPGTKRPLDRRAGAVYRWIFKHRMTEARAASFFLATGCDIGIVAGAPSDDLAVLDIEAPHVEAFMERYGHLLPDTPIASTPSGGIHIYVRDFSGQPTCNIYLDGIRIGELRRAAPSYVVAPPAEGRAWITAPPWGLRLAYLPSWISELRRNPSSSSKGQTSTQRAADRPPEHLLPPIDVRVRFAAERLTCGIVPVAVQKSNGHSALLRAAVETVRGYCVTTGDGIGNRAFDVLWEVFNPICLPPWRPDEDHEIIHKIDEAERVGNLDWGELLDYRLSLAVALGEVTAGECGVAECEVGDSVAADAPAAPVGAHTSGGRLIDLSTPSPSPPSTPSPAPNNLTANELTSLVLGGAPAQRSTTPPRPQHPPQSRSTTHRSIRTLMARMPSRSIAPDDLLMRLRSDIREIAENGPRPDASPDSRAFVVALGAMYAGADVISTTALLLSCKGGVAVQQARDPSVYARELWLDAWRGRNRETAWATVMIVDKILIDTRPDPNRTRALSRATFKLRPVDKPSTPTFEHQISYAIAVKLGPPNAGQISGEWREASAACEAGTRPGCRSKFPAEAWEHALVGAVLDDENRKVRHLIPLDAERRDQIRAALAVCAAFAAFSTPNSINPIRDSDEGEPS